MRKDLFILIVCVAGVVACTTAVEPAASLAVTLATTRTDYVVGETISLELINRSAAPVGYGACSLRLERLDSNQWVLVKRGELACIAIMYIVGAGAARDLQFRLDQTLKPGVYRLVEDIFPDTRLPTARIFSPQFNVSR